MIVCPAGLNDKPKRGGVWALIDLAGFHGGMIARGDVADVVVDQVGSDAYLGQRFPDRVVAATLSRFARRVSVRYRRPTRGGCAAGRTA